MTLRPKDALHRQAALDLLRWFRDQKLRVDVLGIQGHIGTDQSIVGQMSSDDTTPQYAEWTQFLKDAAVLDYTLLVTEFDVNDRKVDGDIARRDAVVADVAKTYIGLTLGNTPARS
jgi:endo-1,4-beta-xylanase